MNANSPSQILTKYRAPILAFVFIGLVIGSLAPFVIKARYKSVATVSISPKYFQHPLVRDFMSELYDPTELRSQRESLIRQAFNDQFLDGASQRLNLTTGKETPLEQAKIREAMARSIEVIPLMATEYQLGFIASERESSQKVLQEGLTNLSKVMKRERLKTLTALRNAVSEQVTQIGSGKRINVASVNGSSNNEAAKIASELFGLKRLFSDQHPLVRELEARLKFLAANPDNGAGDEIAFPDQQTESVTIEAQKLTYADLIRKLSYLDISLKVEASSDNAYIDVMKAPSLPLGTLGPSRATLMLWGALAGFFFATVLVLVREALRDASVGASTVASTASAQKSPDVRSPAAHRIFDGSISETFIESEEPSRYKTKMIDDEPPAP